jgi:16S rRNA (uracil1498-N3)-methyltransferase
MASLRDRFFVEGVRALGERIAFAPDDARKLATVLRAREGERVEVVDSAGNAWAATIVLDGAQVGAMLDERLARAPRELGARIAIAQAIPKGSKMDFVVEKATELGVAELIPLRSERVAGDHTGAQKVDRWQRLARAAAQQSGRSVVPTVTAPTDWDALLARFPSFERVYIPWELADPAPLRDAFEADAARLGSVLFVIGPEGGFAADEVARARTAGAVPLSLGARVLRTETAALVVLAAFAYARGEL